jgi:RNA polymerase sigma-54 factor
VIGNLNGDGYLTASDEEILQAFEQECAAHPADPIPFERGTHPGAVWQLLNGKPSSETAATGVADQQASHTVERTGLDLVHQARIVVNRLDPVGVGARDLRECLLIQIRERKREARLVLERSVAQSESDASAEIEEIAALPAENGAHKNGNSADIFDIATLIVSEKLQLLQKRDLRELTKACGRSVDQVQAAVDFIRTLDPRPGQRYDTSQTRLIEPDVAFVKRDDEYVVVVNEDDLPSLRLSHAYRKMLREKGTEKDVREYVKERYKSAIQLLRNIEQRKNTIVRTCEAIVRRQREFLERGEQALKPMMIKEVAEEIGVHPSTVSRAVANKYVHTSQGVYELRYFFSEGVNGPEGADLPLLLLKRKVKKLIEDEDPSKPLTDDHLAAELQRQGIRVTRRTVAKYREDMQIPSTHQRRVR